MEATVDHFEVLLLQILLLSVPSQYLVTSLSTYESFRNMSRMVEHCMLWLQSLLRESSEPLSFIVCIPDWRDPPTEALMRLEASTFNRKQTVISAHEHQYRHGFQHVMQEYVQ